MKIQEIYDSWISAKSLQVKESTVSTYMMVYSSQIKPVFGEKEYSELTMADLQNFINLSISARRSRKTVMDSMIIIKMILNWAQDEFNQPPVPGRKKLLYPTENASLKKNLEVLSIEEQKKLIEYCKENLTLETLAIMLTLSTGLRIGEVAGLQFRDFDFDNKVLTVNRCVERFYRIEQSGAAKTKVVVGPPKTASSHRRVPVQPFLLKIIKKYAAIHKPQFFLCSGTAAPMEPRILRNHFGSTCDLAGVRRIKFHGLRHTFATTLLEKKVDIKTASEILGHSDVSITMNTYMHPSDEMKRNAVKLLSNLFHF